MSKMFALPALILGSVSLTACSGHGFSGKSAAAGCNPVAYNCAPGTYGAYGNDQYGSYGSGAYGASGYGGYGLNQMSYGGTKSRYGTYTELAGYQQFSFASAGQPYAAQPYVYQSYMAQPPMQVPALRSNVSYQAPSAVSSHIAAPANCPAGTTAQPDGTCLQGSSYTSSSTYSATPSYTSSISYAAPPAATHISGARVDCPAGTKPISDGTCLQTGESYSFSSSSTSYASTPSYSASATRKVPPPISEYNWGNATNSYGLGGGYASAMRPVEAPNNYVQQESSSYGSNTNYSYQPTRK
jgi:hypothetical protein